LIVFTRFTFKHKYSFQNIPYTRKAPKILSHCIATVFFISRLFR